MQSAASRPAACMPRAHIIQKNKCPHTSPRYESC